MKIELVTCLHKVPLAFKLTVLRIDLGLTLGHILNASSADVVPTEPGCINLWCDILRALSRRTGR